MSAKRKRYSVAFKKGIVEASRGKNLTAFCKERKLDLRMVRRWRAEHDEGNAEQRKGGKSSRQPMFPELETLLCGWIAERRAKALEVRRGDIQEFALAVAPQLEIPPEAFKALQRWLDGFLHRYERSPDHSQPLPMAGAEQDEGPATASSVSSCGKDPEAKEAEVQGCLALCGMCNQSVSNRETLGDHQYSRKHKLHCTECNRSFAFQGQLSQHMLVHLQGIQLHCDHCNLCFSSQKALEVHKRVHLLDWPLHCSICNCSFSDAASFDHHQQSHAPGQVRRCLECNVYFTDSLALQEHKRTHAEDWPFRCAQCDRTFVHEGLLREHLLNHSRTRSRRCHICGSWLSYRGMELSEGQLYYCRKCKTSCHVQGSPGAVAAAAVVGSPDKGSA